ncbi:MAG: 4-alpha-glucanotransferase [Clostridiales bacterium]|nr:4-alpha-glucanotransferase [Clostridiales bacterium]
MRKAGILMHITSLASDYGIGTIGKEAYDFVDFLKKSEQHYWQILPLNPTGLFNSPYQSPSVFAGNPLLIDLNTLIAEGLLEARELEGLYFGDDEERVDFRAVNAYKTELLKRAFARFGINSDYTKFSVENDYWLLGYALYMALKEHFDGKPWYEWEEDIKNRRPAAVKKYTELLWDKIEFYKFEQYLFFRQWDALKTYAHENGVEIIGDIPIYVALDSADVWTNTNFFQLDKDKKPTKVAGCPPDAFCKEGQLWNNPLYDWRALKQSGYVWWIRRIQESCKMYDVIRLDHFRGFESYYAIPADSENAKNGEWEKGPGAAFFRCVRKHVPEARFIAEDLGFLTDEVRSLLAECGFPGMKILQFAFDPYHDNPYLPYNYSENCVAYTGTHDNDTLIGWYENEGNKEFIRDYLNVADDAWVPAAMIRTVLASRAGTVIIPIQDYLGYGRRINTPSTANEENWSYRLKKGALHDGAAYNIAHLTKLYKRA